MRVLFLLPLLALVINAGLTGPAHAQTASGEPPAAESVNGAIPAMPLGKALNLFAERTGLQLVYVSEVVAGLETQGAPADLSPDATLQSLLRDTGLDYRFLNARTVTIATPEDLREQSALAGQNQVGKRRPGIEEIIVTGQKREERIQDVPIAISAFTQEDLTVSQIAGGPDLHLQVPNMTFTKTNFTGYSIQIRGIGTQAISATTDPAVAVALNNTPFIRNRFFEQEFYDMERVEVLRGPQGTLFGRNATAGVVNLITNKPKFQYESMASLDIGNYNSRRWEFMVNTPLVEDEMALRIAAAGTKRDGYATNEITDSPIDGRDLWSSRVSLRFAPKDGPFDINLIWEHFEEDDDRLRSGKQLCKKDVITEVGGMPVAYLQRLPDNGQQGGTVSNVQSVFSQGCVRNSLYAEDSFQTPNGLSIPYYFQVGSIGVPRALIDPYVEAVQSSDLRVIESTVEPEYRAKTDIGELQISFELTDSLTLDSETAYLTDSIFSLQDFNRFNTARGAWVQPDDTTRGTIREGLLEEGSEGGIFCDPQIGCSDRLVAVGLSTAESEQFSQELRLSSSFSGPFNFSLGANYLSYDTEDKYYVFVNSLSLAAAQSFRSAPYVPGESDNTECLANWLLPLDPNDVYQVNKCLYMDQNPIGSLNDSGHNYFLSRNPYELDSYGVFGETYYKITDNLKLTAGLRWSVDKKKAPRIPTWLMAGDGYGLPVADVIEQTWREPTGRLVLDWKPNFDFTDETLIYGSYARGYKAGGANPPTFVYSFYSASTAGVGGGLQEESATRPKTFDAEFVDAFEIGTKNTFADGAVTLNAAAFYYDYQDYQISEIVDRSAFNRNFDAEVWGAELEADWWVTERLRLGFKGGYQRTRIRDGEQAVDLMDRTAGGKHFTVTDAVNPNFDPSLDPRPVSEYVTGVPLDELPADQEFFAFEDWTIVRPFPTFASNCILPTWLYKDSGREEPLWGLGAPNGGSEGGCEIAYVEGLDPVTVAPYQPNPQPGQVDVGGGASFGGWENPYPGWDPATAPNNGEGFFKDLGGNEFPNSPHYTTTFKVDYTIPLRGDWLVTAHTDIYWQSKSWWRIFNDHEYNRLDEYFTMNLAAIFMNDVSGWNIMAYVKNVTDEDAITGAFLSADDTGLTSNVFLVEPRLYGLRVTKRWDGDGPAAWLGSAGSTLLGKQTGEPSPFSLTLGGQRVSYESPYENLSPTFTDAFGPPLNVFDEPQNEDLDSGDGREIELAYRPNNGPWTYSLSYRDGRANGGDDIRVTDETPPICVFEGVAFIEILCVTPFDDPLWQLVGERFQIMTEATGTNWLEVEVDGREQHRLIDLAVSREMPLFGLDRSAFGISLRHAHFESETSARFFGIPDWELGTFIPSGFPGVEIPTTHTRYDSRVDAHREFEGLGPMASWDAAFSLVDNGSSSLDLEWALSAGVLFGRQETTVSGTEEVVAVELEPITSFTGETVDYQVADLQDPPDSSSFRYERDDRDMATVPVVEGELGLTYRIGGASVGAGYRWERYYGVIDGGFEERKMFDRTVDGPYFRVTFGGGE